MQKKIKVKICVGTTCYVMGGGELLVFKEALPKEMQDKIEMEMVPCLGMCKKEGASAAPFVEVDGELLRDCTKAALLEKIIKITEESDDNVK